MNIVKPSYEIMTEISLGGEKELRLIERIARTCYKSEPKTESIDEVKEFVRRLIKRKHLAMIEHSLLTVRFVCDRGISHEIVRHRIASFAQESTRWCNYGKDRFGGITVVAPEFGDSLAEQMAGGSEYAYLVWKRACESAEEAYLYLTGTGKVAPQQARSVLPTCLKTELVMSTNYREWRHFFELRGAKDAHPQVQKLANGLLEEVKTRIPIIFDDL